MWMIAGRIKAKVFPDPVCAIPIMSFPLRARGQPILGLTLALDRSGLDKLGFF